jgi:opacity protein-like surface antigen
MNTPSGPAKYNGTVLTATLVGRLPLNERIEAIARAGIGRSRIDVSASDYSYHSESKKNPFVWGMGARFRISPSFAVTLDYDQLGKVGKYSNGNHVRVDMISAGVQFNF